MVKIACIQLTSGVDLPANIVKIESMVENAARGGAQFVATPENSFLMNSNEANKIFYKENEHPAISASANMALKHKIWLLIGSVAVDGGNNKSYNRSLLFNPDGEIVARYDKIHLFDVEVGDGQTYRESARIIAGDRAVVAETLYGKIGMSVCYDLRFPQLYRALAKAGAMILTIPSAFTEVTGEAHWHVLLRARAIENSCFVVAPAQTGTHAGGRKTYGHSLIVDPWGRVLADAGSEEGVIFADIDLNEVSSVRAKLPSLQHDREFNLS